MPGEIDQLVALGQGAASLAAGRLWVGDGTTDGTREIETARRCGRTTVWPRSRRR